MSAGLAKADRETLAAAAQLDEARERALVAARVESARRSTEDRRRRLEAGVQEAASALDVFTKAGDLIGRLTRDQVARCGSAATRGRLGMGVPSSSDLAAILANSVRSASDRLARLTAELDELQDKT